MAKQIAGLTRLVRTIDGITFYKMEGEYYARKQSSLTAQRVKTKPEFWKTMYNAGILARASKIGSLIYKALPPSWRQFWMYRSFTGEAILMLKAGKTEAEAHDHLWACYVDYWIQWEAANPVNPVLAQIKQPKPQKIRKRRVWTLEALLRKRDKFGKPIFKDPRKEEEKRLKRERSDAAWQKVLDQKRVEELLRKALEFIEQVELPHDRGIQPIPSSIATPGMEYSSSMDGVYLRRILLKRSEPLHSLPQNIPTRQHPTRPCSWHALFTR